MSETGFFAQKRNSPTSLGAGHLLHGGLIAAVVLIKGTALHPRRRSRCRDTIEARADPPPDQPPPAARAGAASQVERRRR